MDDFLGMLRKAADRLLGQGHSYGTATDEAVTRGNEFASRTPEDPNVQYAHESIPRLQKMPALEQAPVKPAKPDERIQRAIQSIRRQNEAIDAELKRGSLPEGEENQGLDI